MATAEHTTTIGHDIEAVFDFIADGTNNDKWRDGIVESSLKSGDGGLGSVWHQVVSAMGQKVDATYKVTVYERPTKLTFETTGGMVKGGGSFELSEDGPGRTTLRQVLEANPQGALKLMGGMVKKQIASQVKAIDAIEEAMGS